MLSLELVPKNIEDLKNEVIDIQQNHPEIQQINIPDILRLPIRSDEATLTLLKLGMDTIPHLRTVDRDIKAHIECVQNLMSAGLKNILLISGDPPKNNPHFKSSQLSPIDVIGALKKEFPQLNVYAALDPYRSSIQDELNYIQQKRDTGFDGFFSQPFFSLQLLEFWLDELEGTELYAGFSPITTEKSKKYWEGVNRVPLKKDMECSLEASGNFTLKGLELVQKYKQNAYLMPITISAKDFLSHLKI